PGTGAAWAGGRAPPRGRRERRGDEAAGSAGAPEVSLIACPRVRNRAPRLSNPFRVPPAPRAAEALSRAAGEGARQEVDSHGSALGCPAARPTAGRPRVRGARAVVDRDHRPGRLVGRLRLRLGRGWRPPG